MIKRSLQSKIAQRLFKGKAVLILGARQVGKTTLLKTFLNEYRDEAAYFNCDEPDIRQVLTNATSTELSRVIGKKRLLLIDEAQRVENIGLTLKLLVDNFPERQVIASGSSAFELANKINEPLTGRKFEFQLHPLSMHELMQHYGYIEARRMLEQSMIYGLYPEVVVNYQDARELLMNLAASYLYRDIFEWQQVRKPELLDKLLKALALQVGSQVSYNELATMLEVRKETIASYLQMLEKVFVIFRLGSYSRNLRNELTKKQKFYFWDTGVRNTLISNFQPLAMRTDAGALWENFIIAERMKRNGNALHYCNSFFWRTRQQQEIDYIEEYDGNLHAYEFKWNPKKKTRFPRTFLNAYPGSETAVITSENWTDFVMENE